MNCPKVVIIDYGMGNLLSVRRGFEHCGAEVIVSAEPAVILAAPRVVLPGVGSFKDGIAELRRLGLDEVICEVALKGTPLLGICLGMQMLLDDSEEFGITAGLRIIHGRVVHVPALSSNGVRQKIPHIGWNELILSPSRDNWEGTLLQDVIVGEAVYFVHSFMASPIDVSHRIADCSYGGQVVSAAVGFDNVFGCQFHPEKSGETGLKILRSFLRR